VNTNTLPALPLAAWKETYETLHMWIQIVGKIQLKLTPIINHWWNVTLFVTARGLATSVMNYDNRLVQMNFDFIDHLLRIETDDGRTKSIALRPRSVADFYREVMTSLESLDIPVTIWSTPAEVPNPIPFEQDQKHTAYDKNYANRIWRILAYANRVLLCSDHNSLGKLVRYIFSGEDSIWPLLAFRDDLRLCIRVLHTVPILWMSKPILMK
jgi:Family of unknown function (DUF5996)